MFGNLFALLVSAMSIQHPRRGQLPPATPQRIGHDYGSRRRNSASTQEAPQKQGTVEKIKDFFGITRHEIQHAANAHYQRLQEKASLASIEKKTVGPRHFADSALLNYLSTISKKA